MANLGSTDTPIEGESFGLPSGWAIVENAAGEVVIEDSGGNAVFRRDETAGEWVTDSIDAESVSVEDASITNGPTEDDDALRWQEGVEVGSASISGRDRSDEDDGWNGNDTQTISLSFDNAFGSTPTIVTSADSSEDLTGGFMVNVENPSATGFDMEFTEYHGLDRSDRTLGGTYIATEGR